MVGPPQLYVNQILLTSHSLTHFFRSDSIPWMCVLLTSLNNATANETLRSNPLSGAYRFCDAILKNNSRKASTRYINPDNYSEFGANLLIDIVDRCQPPIGATDPEFGLSSWQICTQPDNGILRDGFRSFPSGHSSSTSIPLLLAKLQV